MANNIEVYQNNSKTISCVVSGLSLTGYTPYLTVKKSPSSTTLINNTGSISDPSTALFNLSSTDTSIASGEYMYDITVVADSSIYTVVKDSFTVLDGVKY